MTTLGTGLSLTAFALGLVAATAEAADLPANLDDDKAGYVDQRIGRAWEFTVAPYFVGANIVGTAQVGRLPSTDVDVSTGDIIENLHFGGMIHAEALFQQRFGAALDIAYMKLGSSTDLLLTGGRARVGAKQLIVETFLSYRLHHSDTSYVDVFAGGRYWDVTLDLNVTGSIAGSFTTARGDNWWDPVIGLRGFHRFGEKWSINARADIGGFGAGSDFSWNVQGGAGYHINETWSAHLNYKVLSVDYDNGKSGNSSFEYDTITHGPLLGVMAKF
ncbi:hypothetical protein DYI23_16465 [Roseibium polysiphoniae]|uniref:Outer membrane protein beta-barrel domain-containing protein n=1 Tax=Roseibium polysiphoniae TaxID=2571221 RepID=A0A944CFD1_9HYPH|nr:hypothetical protein [Roseibium polysiphoniae]MBS8261823.1 hypothetical protein [Roseibium polysiphoniae]